MFWAARFAGPSWRYKLSVTRTHDKVSDSPKSKGPYSPASAAQGVEQALSVLSGRWKLLILFHLFGGQVQRFSDLERLLPNISQKMLAQQLRQMERDGMIQRTIHPLVPPKVEYRLTEWGQSLCPALDALLAWLEDRPADSESFTAEKSSAPGSGASRVDG